MHRFFGGKRSETTTFALPTKLPTMGKMAFAKHFLSNSILSCTRVFILSSVTEGTKNPSERASPHSRYHRNTLKFSEECKEKSPADKSVAKRLLWDVQHTPHPFVATLKRQYEKVSLTKRDLCKPLGLRNRASAPPTTVSTRNKIRPTVSMRSAEQMGDVRSSTEF